MPTRPYGSRPSRLAGPPRPRARLTAAERADPFLLYQEAVQKPEADIAFFLRLFRQLRGRAPRTLREDFCGTALLARDWVRGHGAREAWGVDNDRPTLAWAEAHAASSLSPKARARLHLVEADVRSVRRPKVDLACGLNFSLCVLRTRRELLEYFAAAHAGLEKDGIYLTELYGGTEAMVPGVERRDFGRFEYLWEQECFDPITHRARCHIGFAFPDGSALPRAFSYDWRLWTVPELCDALDEVGFRKVLVYWQTMEDDGTGSGRYELYRGEENQETWLVFLAALR